MKARHSVFLASLLTVASTSALANDPSRDGALPVPANRIAGLWAAQAAVSPCGSALPPSPVATTLLFAAGGTVVENPRFPPGGLPDIYGVPGQNQRTGGYGTWSFNPMTAQYRLHLQFDWYVDGAYHGYQTVDRTITLSLDGRRAAGPVTSVRHAADGSVIAAVCGSVVSQRL